MIKVYNAIHAYKQILIFNWFTCFVTVNYSADIVKFLKYFRNVSRNIS